MSTAELAGWSLSPSEVYSANSQYSLEADLNQDGFPDIVVELGAGRKIPMYGTEKGNYISASKMVERNPDSTIDYRSILLTVNGQ